MYNGKWKTNDGEKLLIKGNLLIWLRERTKQEVQYVNGEITFTFDTNIYSGKISNDGQNIHWTDGDLWVRLNPGLENIRINWSHVTLLRISGSHITIIGTSNLNPPPAPKKLPFLGGGYVFVD
jgi:hypothetical protein